ncbi:MAG: hypothetical protein ABI947_28170 [Chloroflexota bacterium]
MTYSKTLVNVQKIALTLLGVAVVLMACDPIVGFLADRFYPEPPYIMLDLPSFYGLDRFWQMTDSGQKPIVFTGSSMVFHAISPHTFDSAIETLTGKSVISVNVGVTEQTSDIVRDLIHNIFIPKGAAAIVYATEMRAYSGRIALPLYRRSPLGYTMQLDTLRRTVGLWLLQHSAFARYRNNLHDMLTGARPFESAKGYYNDIDDRGHAFASIVWDVTRLIPVPNEFTPLVIDAPYREALGEIAVDCQQSHTPCVVVNMPLHRLQNKLIPASDQVQYVTMLKDTIRNGKVTLWDFNTEACISFLGDGDFMDGNHMNEFGAQKFTSMLAILYAHQFMGQPIPPESHTDCVQVTP